MPGTAYPPPPPPARFLDNWLRTMRQHTSTWQAVTWSYGRVVLDGVPAQLCLTTATGPLRGELHPFEGGATDPDQVDLLMSAATFAQLTETYTHESGEEAYVLALDAAPSSKLTHRDGTRHAIELARAGQVHIVRVVPV